jgi:DNA repair protein RadC
VIRAGGKMMYLVGNRLSAGKPTPTPDEKVFAGALQEAASVVGISLLDFVVVSSRENKFTSMVAAGVLGAEKDEG